MRSSVKRDCLDRISSLPDELLGHMLSFLPTKCAVSTSILSTRWRYLFTLTNCLSFDEELYDTYFEVSKEIAVVQMIRFKKFVYNVLESHQISIIKKFSLDIYSNYDRSDLNAWVSTAVKKGVEDLEFRVIIQTYHELPDDLFVCETLVRLKIICSGRYGVQNHLSAWLPSLEILHLEFVRFLDYDSVERLFSGCKSLKELNLWNCGCDTECHFILSTGLLKVLTIESCSFSKGLFEIDAPNLAYLIYNLNTGVKIIPSWKHSFSLVEANLKFNYVVDHVSDKKSLQYDRELVTAAAYKATELYLPVELLLKLDEHKEMPVFHNLSRLHLCGISYKTWKYVTSLIDKSPQLETLIFGGTNRCWYGPLLPYEPLPPFSCEAKVIEMHYFCENQNSLKYLGHLLINAPLLKKVILHIDESYYMGEGLPISNDLLLLPRASKDCRIQVQLRDCCIEVQPNRNFSSLVSTLVYSSGVHQQCF